MKAILVDDEPLARFEMRRLLRAHPEIEIVGEAEDGEEGLRLIEELAPEVLFLDVQMPGMTGFDLLEKIDRDLPEVIFTTAYDQHAIQAFEVNALDYLLKPIAPERLAGALSRLGGEASEEPLNTGIRARCRPLLDCAFGRHLSAGERGELYTPVVRDGTTAYSAIAQRLGATTRSAELLSRESTANLEFELGARYVPGGGRRLGGDADRRPGGGAIATTVGGITGSAESLAILRRGVLIFEGGVVLSAPAFAEEHAILEMNAPDLRLFPLAHAPALLQGLLGESGAPPTFSYLFITPSY